MYKGKQNIDKTDFLCYIVTKGDNTMEIVTVSESNTLTHFKAHDHDTWEITLVLSGSITFINGDKTYRTSVGDVYIIPPKVMHSGYDGENYRDIYIKGTGLGITEPAIIHDYDGSIKALFKMIKRASNEKEENYLGITNKLYEALCEYIKKYVRTEVKYGFVIDIKNKIYENISNPDFQISEEIRKSGFNTDYFRRCFKNELGETPLEYMTRLRLEKAKKLLTQRSFISVERVAMECGFTDTFYFSKAFKKHNGISPREYRKTHETH